MFYLYLRVPGKNDLLERIENISKEQKKESEEIKSLYKDIQSRQLILLDRLVRVEEKRVENEAKFLDIMASLVNKL